ncbi:hypothetical protein FA09DRAFT_331730 [Tilletiopsis washingtonensis]|jgi:hypothetical protein|uniref:Uncharacterized protein n=1 Tax=Tilletiopsis washingtonensis TaxID=58919 RepID=A0A316Z1U3_9BASI|nr:hypothetical protein FA09DRAFT_331730 [Tilletiopsis washingtonensis]PWN95760.1 hypothetical protein FA09DRAFT_331730 [Tilletiopsis washingtonensis]
MLLLRCCALLHRTQQAHASPRRACMTATTPIAAVSPGAATRLASVEVPIRQPDRADQQQAAPARGGDFTSRAISRQGARAVRSESAGGRAPKLPAVRDSIRARRSGLALRRRRRRRRRGTTPDPRGGQRKPKRRTQGAAARALHAAGTGAGVWTPVRGVCGCEWYAGAALRERCERRA